MPEIESDFVHWSEGLTEEQRKGLYEKDKPSDLQCCL